jgi:prepilin-type N-terminal cleavage/methylation domain-containing protein
MDGSRDEPGGIVPPPSAAGVRGFTLIELLVVVAVIGILVAIAVPIVTSVVQQRARLAKAEADARVLATSVSLYAVHAGRLPDALALTTATVADAQGLRGGPFLVAVPQPPQGWSAYAYTTSADGSFRISATGDGTTVRAP